MSMQVCPGLYYQFLENLSAEPQNKPPLMAQLLDTDNKSYTENLLGGLSVITGIIGEAGTTFPGLRIVCSHPGI